MRMSQCFLKRVRAMGTPRKNVAYTFYMALVDNSTGSFRVDPTIDAGDFQVSKDGGAFANLATLPTVEPSGSISVKVELSADEMNADKVFITAIDASGSEWNDSYQFIDTVDEQLTELWQLQGLDSDNPMTVTKTARTVDNISQLISGDGSNTSTVTRQ